MLGHVQDAQCDRRDRHEGLSHHTKSFFPSTTISLPMKPAPLPTPATRNPKKTKVISKAPPAGSSKKKSLPTK